MKEKTRKLHAKNVLHFFTEMFEILTLERKKVLNINVFLHSSLGLTKNFGLPGFQKKNKGTHGNDCLRNKTFRKQNYI